MGLAVTSHVDGTLCTATFDNVRVSGGSTPPPGDTAPAAPASLAVNVVSATDVRLSWADRSSNETGFEIYRATGLAVATRIAGVGANIMAYADTTVTPDTSYTYSVRAINAAGSSAYSNTVLITTPRRGIDGGAPGWTSQDIGTTTAGSTSVSGSTITLRGSGRGIADSPDGFRFYYQLETEPDCDIVARVTGLTNTGEWAKAGVMFRRSLEPNSAYAMIAITPGHGVAVQRRNSAGSSTTDQGPLVTAPYWLKLSRRGINYSAHASTDGVNWTTLSGFNSSDNSSSEPLYVGLVVSSHSDGALCTATFDNVTLTKGLATGNAPSLAGEALSSSEIRLTWTDTTPDETQFEIQYQDSSGFRTIGAVDANQTTFTITGLAAGLYYSYRVRALNANGTTPYSNTVMVQTQVANTPPAAPSSLVATAISSTEVRLTWNDNSNNETGFRIYRAIDIGSAQLLTSLGANVASYADTSAAPGTRYAYFVTGYNSAGSTESERVVVTTPGDAAAPWTRSDIGLVGAPGGATQNGDTIIVRGSGDDIWGTQDSFHFYNRTFNGDGEISVRVTALDNTDGWAKAGVMMRTTTAPDAPYVFICVNPQFTVAWQHRLTAGAEAVFDGAYGWPPAWLKIVRAGNLFTLHYSQDGTRWLVGESVQVTMPATVLAGLAVTSHRRGTVASATFDQLVVRQASDGSPPPPGPAAPAAPSNLAGSAISSTSIRLTWTDNANNETGFEVERRTASTSFSRSAVLGANAVTYTDTAFTPDETGTYIYRVRAINGAGASAYTPEVSVSKGASMPTWSNADIGNYGLGGSWSVTQGSPAITVRGSGEDIWANADGFYFVYQPLRGDGQIVARVQSMENTHAWAKAGLMIRESLAANSRHAFVFMTYNSGGLFHARTAVGGSTSIIEGPWWADPPYWLKIERRGNTFTAHTSADGVTWTLLTTETIDMGADALIGLGVTAHDVSKINTATFTDVQIASP